MTKKHTEAPTFNGLYMNNPWVHYTPEEPMDDDNGTIVLKTDPTKRRFKGVTYHGNTPFDVTFMTLVDPGLEVKSPRFALWQGGCETNLVLPEEIEHVVSLYPWERYIYKHELRSETYVYMRDSIDQGTEQVSLLAEWVNHCRETGPTAVTCQAGLNRSSLVVAKALHLQGFGSGDDIVEHLREVRSPAALCNPRFEAEVRSWPKH